MSLGIPMFKVGDMADMKRWDKYCRPRDKFGVCEVVEVKTAQRCESSFMITVKRPDGHLLEVDQNWAAQASPSVLQ